MKDTCFMLPVIWKTADGEKAISIRRTAAMGDAIAGTVVCDRLIDLGYTVTYAVHDLFHPILKLHPRIAALKNQNFIADITLDGAYEKDPRRRTMSFAELFIERANAQLTQYGFRLPVKNCTPRLVPAADFAPAIRHFQPHAKPWVIINPRAAPVWHGRHVPNAIWTEAAPKIHGTCFWLGQDPAPTGIVDLHCREVAQLAPVLSFADLVISVDTGPMHLAAALGKPVLAISQNSSPALHLTDQVDWEMVSPDLDCLNCQLNVCKINATVPPCQNVPVEYIVRAANLKLQAITGNDVSCVIPIYKPTAERVNRCLESVLPQVNEVVLTVDASGVVPSGIISSPKVRLVKARLPRIGVGPNINHGVRHTHGKFVLLLNDDVVLRPDAVAKMMECMKPGVGAAAHLLHYPDGQIYFANKVRSPDGGIGHYHLDHRKFRHTITEPVESENLCGASVLVRREAFYQAGCFDDRFLFYAEDDSLSMSMRSKGWRLIYTPHAVGIHEEGQSTRLIGDRLNIMQQSNALFGQLWGRYYSWNKGRLGLGNFDYLTQHA